MSTQLKLNQRMAVQNTRNIGQHVKPVNNFQHFFDGSVVYIQ